MNVRPHVAQNVSGRRSVIGKRTTRHRQEPAHPQTHRGGVRLNQDCRRPVPAKLMGLAKVDWAFAFPAAYDLARAPKPIAAAA